MFSYEEDGLTGGEWLVRVEAEAVAMEKTLFTMGYIQTE